MKMIPLLALGASIPLLAIATVPTGAVEFKPCPPGVPCRPNQPTVKGAQPSVPLKPPHPYANGGRITGANLPCTPGVTCPAPPRPPAPGLATAPPAPALGTNPAPAEGGNAPVAPVSR